MGVAFRVKEDDRLGHLADVENRFNEVWLLALLTAELELFDVVQLQLLLLKADLVSLRGKKSNFFLHCLRVRGREENVLNFIGKLGNILRMELLKLVQVFLFTKENIGLVKDEALKLRKINLARSFLQVVVQLSKSGNNNLRVGATSCSEVCD